VFPVSSALLLGRRFMSKAREKKAVVVKEVEENLTSSSGVLVTEYRGLSVSEITELRRLLRPLGAKYKVYKNTLVKRALNEIGVSGLEPILEGPTALAIGGTDVVGVAKTLKEFAKSYPALIIKGGLIEGEILDNKGVQQLADLPSKEQMLARLAGDIKAPLNKLAYALSALPRQFAYGLKALADKKEGEEK
jgi:large subunit ribosomal protein L10